jgi:hypothetical protein
MLHGYGTHSGQKWPVSGDTWWFAPNSSRQSGPSPSLAAYLGGHYINIIVILYRQKKTRKWPRPQTTANEEREVKGFQGWNLNNAIWAAENMFTKDGCASLPACIAEFHGAAS